MRKIYQSTVGSWTPIYYLPCHVYSFTPQTTHLIDTGDAVIGSAFPPIPWMLTKEDISMVDTRFRQLVIPHNVHAFCTYKEGLLTNKSSCWRMISKMQVLYMLPVLLRGTIPGLLSALSKLVYALWLMCGRVISERRRRQTRCCVSVVLTHPTNHYCLHYPAHMHILTAPQHHKTGV